MTSEIRKRVSSEAVQVAISASSEATPPGWNAGRRYVARLVLWFVVLTLLAGKQIWATVCSAVAIIILKEGTLFSGKNIKWMLLSGISFLCSLGSWNFERGFEAVDEDKAYGLKISLWLMSKSLSVVWGMVLALFLFSAATAKPTTTTTTTTEVTKKQY